MSGYIYTRRKVIVGAALSAAATLAEAAQTQSYRPWEYGGCCLTAAQADALYSESGYGERGASIGQLQKRSGDRELDRAMGITMSRISNMFHVYPGFFFFSDPSPNAFATPQTQVAGTSGTVAFGLNLLRQQVRKVPSGVSVLGILAHEFGHILQFQSGFAERLRVGQTTARLVELHADFLAGYFAGKRFSDVAGMDTDSLGDAFKAIGDYQVNNQNHHGSPKERLRALSIGFRYSRDRKGDLNDALPFGANAVSHL